MIYHVATPILLAALVTAVGCNPGLRLEEEIELKVGEIGMYIVDATTQLKTLDVRAESSGSPISVYVYPNEFDEEVDRMITLGKPSDYILASETEAESIVLTVPVEANQEAVVRIHNVGREVAQVKLTIQN